MTEQPKQERGRRQVKVGTVVSNKMNQTVVVAVEKTVLHRLYRRHMKRTSTFHAHDEGNEAEHPPGDPLTGLLQRAFLIGRKKQLSDPPRANAIQMCDVIATNRTFTMRWRIRSAGDPGSISRASAAA